ncbi:hypothetical protein H6P81_016501 [Aristolochia fimbriata]|uniref:Nudix hydrolase domain-containing protein n=1 Tax=Aristolochia fimbriata TaxID=158543 RepID=A0AAV7E9S3_ARIFI|nr:hypothetical protein H6P81_016501 [Aristolochia fimbriata]
MIVADRFRYSYVRLLLSTATMRSVATFPAFFICSRTSPNRYLPQSLFSILWSSHLTAEVRFPLSSLLRSWKLPVRRGFTRMATEKEAIRTHIVHLEGGEPVEVFAGAGLSDVDFRNAIDSSLFKQWLKNLQSDSGILCRRDISLKRVLIQGVDMFGRRIGFLKFKADVVDKETGQKIPGIAFSRGPAVAVLILLEADGQTFVALTDQARVPVGKFILELPAGMIDDDGNDVVGTAVREVEEEIGISLKLESMVNLTSFLDPSTGGKVFPSPGGCDEELSLFLYRGRVSEEVIEAMHGKEMGLRDHGEMIRVHVVPYEKLWRVTADAKVLCAIALYEMAKKDGLLPPTA